MVACAATDEKLRDCPVCVVATSFPGGRPTDDFELVVVTVPNDAIAVTNEARSRTDGIDVDRLPRPRRIGAACGRLFRGSHAHVEPTLETGRRSDAGRQMLGSTQVQAKRLYWFVVIQAKAVFGNCG